MLPTDIPNNSLVCY